MKTKKKARVPNIRVTVELLNKMGACLEDVERFKGIWPKGVMPTKSAFLLAADKGLDTWWFGHEVSRSRGFKPLRKFYNERLLLHEQEHGYYTAIAEALTAHDVWKAYCQMVADKTTKKAAKKKAKRK